MKDDKQNDENQSLLEDWFGDEEEPMGEPEPSPKKRLGSNVMGRTIGAIRYRIIILI